MIVDGYPVIGGLATSILFSIMPADTVAGARASANLYSLIETAKANRIEPWRYLNHLFEVLPRVEQADELVPLLPQNVDRDAIRVR